MRKFSICLSDEIAAGVEAHGIDLNTLFARAYQLLVDERVIDGTLVRKMYYTQVLRKETEDLDRIERQARKEARRERNRQLWRNRQYLKQGEADEPKTIDEPLVIPSIDVTPAAKPPRKPGGFGCAR